MGIEKLMKAKVIDKRAFDTDALVTFGSEVLKIATEAPENVKTAKKKSERQKWKGRGTAVGAAVGAAAGAGPSLRLIGQGLKSRKAMNQFYGKEIVNKAFRSLGKRAIVRGAVGTAVGAGAGRLVGEGSHHWKRHFEAKARREAKKTKTANKGRLPHDHSPGPEEFKVTKREAERAARSLADDRAVPRRVARNMATFAVLSPTIGTASKGVAAALTSKGRRSRAALDAMRTAIKDKRGLIEKGVGGAGMGAALSALTEGRNVRRSRQTVESYLKKTRPDKPVRDKLKAVL
jgi:hypothetical protein